MRAPLIKKNAVTSIEGYLSYLLPKFEDFFSTSLGSGAIQTRRKCVTVTADYCNQILSLVPSLRNKLLKTQEDQQGKIMFISSNSRLMFSTVTDLIWLKMSVGSCWQVTYPGELTGMAWSSWPKNWTANFPSSHFSFDPRNRKTRKMRLFLALLIIPALWYHAKQGGIELKVDQISVIVGDVSGKRKVLSFNFLYSWPRNLWMRLPRPWRP